MKDRRTRPRSGGDKEGTRQANGGNRWGKHDEFLHYVHLVSLSLLVMLSLSRLFALRPLYRAPSSPSVLLSSDEASGREERGTNDTKAGWTEDDRQRETEDARCK